MLEQNQIRAQVNDTSVNEEKRTVDLTWTTGAKGMRSSWGDRYYEELSLDPSHVDMSRLNDGSPLLASHDQISLDAVVGVVERAWLEDGKGGATVRFASDEISQRVFQKVKDKILRNVSVGYSVSEYTDVSNEGDEIPTLRATRWTPMELSIVPIGFDKDAKVRSENKTENEVEIITRSETMETSPMSEEEKKALADKLQKESVQAERTRVLEITRAVKEAKLPESMAQEYIERGTSVSDAKENIAMFVKYQAEQEATRVSSTTRAEVGQTHEEKKRVGLTDALLNRVDNRNFKVTDAGKEFYGKGLLRMIEDMVGRQFGESDAQLAKRAMSSSDLPLILANVAEKAAQARYKLAPRTWERWCAKGTLRNYKEAKQLRSGDFASLVERKESGEFKYGSFSEEQEVAQLKDYGIIHKFTSQMLVNDDLQMISKVSSEGGVAAARLENRLAYSALSTNATMGDGIALYHASHGNLGSAGAFSATTFSAAFLAMRSQTSVDGLDPLNIAPKFLIVPPSLEASAKQFLALVTPAVNSNVNIYSNSVELVVDAQLSDDKYYFVADPNEIEGVKMFHLEGQEQPSIESRTNWSDNSVELKVAHTAAAAPMDWRALYRNEIA